MGNIILTNSFITVPDSNITARSQSTGYDKQNVQDLWHLRQRYRSNDLIKSDSNPLLVYDFGSAQSVAALALIDVNFDKVRIRGHDSDLGTNWSTAGFDSGSDATVPQNVLTKRRHLFLALTDFNCRYLAIVVPAAASAVGSYTTYWEIGDAPALSSASELDVNMALKYRRKAPKAYKDIPLLSGGGERVSLSDCRRFEATLIFENLRSETDEEEIWDINALDESQPFLFYENRGDASAVYVCLRDDGYEGTLVQNGHVTGNSIRIRECI